MQGRGNVNVSFFAAGSQAFNDPLILPSVSHMVEIPIVDIKDIFFDAPHIDLILNQVLPDPGVGDIALEEDPFHSAVF